MLCLCPGPSNVTEHNAGEQQQGRTPDEDQKIRIITNKILMIWFWQRGSVLLVNVSEVSGLTVRALSIGGPDQQDQI